MLTTGTPFPAFSLPDQDGVERSLADYAGKWLVVYFYPKDNTSGCTLEGQAFSGLKEAFAKKNAVILGVSPDTVKSHCNFIAKKELAVSLLSDTEHSLLEAVGVWRKKKMYGREYMGVLRTTVLVGPDGLVREVWENVKVTGHAEAVLERLGALQKE